MKKHLKRTATRAWRWARPMLIVVVALTAFRSAVADWNDVPSGSMNPSILEGDRIFVNKLAYDLKIPYTTWRLARWSEPQRGDIVVFLSPRDGTRLVKRVVGLPGDTIELRNERLLVNGRQATYLFDGGRTLPLQVGREQTAESEYPIQILTSVIAMRSFKPIIVPQGHYFVMGDNRDVSFDSRYFGTVPMENILGKAPAVVISLDMFDHYKPRWDRFFTPLP